MRVVPAKRSRGDHFQKRNGGASWLVLFLFRLLGVRVWWPARVPVAGCGPGGRCRVVWGGLRRRPACSCRSIPVLRPWRPLGWWLVALAGGAGCGPVPPVLRCGRRSACRFRRLRSNWRSPPGCRLRRPAGCCRRFAGFPAAGVRSRGRGCRVCRFPLAPCGRVRPGGPGGRCRGAVRAVGGRRVLCWCGCRRPWLPRCLILRGPPWPRAVPCGLRSWWLRRWSGFGGVGGLRLCRFGRFGFVVGGWPGFGSAARTAAVPYCGGGVGGHGWPGGVLRFPGVAWFGPGCAACGLAGFAGGGIPAWVPRFVASRHLWRFVGALWPGWRVVVGLALGSGSVRAFLGST